LANRYFFNMRKLYIMASLATDEEFEHEMLTAHAEDTFIDNLQILESSNLLEALSVSQSLYNDVFLLKDNPILVKKNDKLKGMTPFDFIDEMGNILGKKYDEMYVKTDNERKQLLVIRSEIQSQGLTLMDDRKSAKQWNQMKRIVTIDRLIVNLQEKEEENRKKLILIETNQKKARKNIDTLKTIKNLLNDAETQYASQEAQKSLIAGEEEKDAQEKAVKAKKEREKEKKRAKKERRRQRLREKEEADRKMAEETLPAEKEKAEEEIEEAPLEEQPQKPEEGKLKEEESEEEVPFTKQIDDIITRLLELHTYGDSLGENFWNNERNKRKAQLKESSKYHAEAVDYLELLQNFLKNSGYKLVVTGGYALRLMTQNLPEYTSKPYKTDDIDVKVCPEEGAGNIVHMRYIVADMIEKTPTFLKSIEGTFFDSSTPDTAGDGNTPLKITAPINTPALGQFRDQRLATILKSKNLDDRQAPIIEITFSSEPCENTTEIKGLNVLDISQLIDNLLNATDNFQERIIAREEGRSRESIYPSKVASWYWQLHQILKILNPHGAIYFSEKLKEETDKKVASSGGRRTKRRKKARKKKTKRRRKAKRRKSRKKKTKRRRKVKRRKKSRKR